MSLNKFDLHNIMSYYCEDEYIITGDEPYKLKMVTMLTGKRPTSKQLNEWAAHFKEWSKKKEKIDMLMRRDDEIDMLYLKAQRRRDSAALKRFEKESLDIDKELAELDILMDPLEDYRRQT